MHVWRRVFLLRNWNEFKWCSVDLNGTSISGEKAVATHSSTLAWQIPWMEEPGRLQSMGSLGVGHDWVTSLVDLNGTSISGEKEMATYSSVLAWRIPGMGEPGGLPSLGSHKSRTWLQRLSSCSSSISGTFQIIAEVLCPLIYYSFLLLLTLLNTSATCFSFLQLLFLVSC